MGINSFNPSVVLPMIRRVYPTLMRASDVGVPSDPCPLGENAAAQVASWSFLSKARMKRLIPFWRLSNGGYVSIKKAIYTNGKPTHVTMKNYFVFDEDSLDEFVVELGNLADLHGILKMGKGEIWVKESTDGNGLNIEPRIMDGIVKRIRKLREIKYSKWDGTIDLEL